MKNQCYSHNLVNKLGLLLLFCLFATSLHAERFVKDSVRIGGEMRRFDVFLPTDIKVNAPLIVVLHGYGGDIWRENPLVKTAREEGFAVCIPQGLVDPHGKRSWNVGYPMQDGWKVDDVKSLCRIASYVQKHYKLSRENTFLTGMSNGGEMCYLMAYSRQKTFRAVAPIAGLTMEWMYRTLQAPTPIPLMEIHGTEDRTSEWTGDPDNKGGWGAYMSVPLAVSYWVARNRCTREVISKQESMKPESGHYIIRHSYTDAESGCDVLLLEVVGAGHTWFTDDMDTGREIWQFFKRYLKE